MYIILPPGTFLQARLLDNQEGAETERYVFGKPSARCFQRRPFWRRHHSSCGDVENGESAQGGVVYTVVHGILVRAYGRRVILLLSIKQRFLLLVWSLYPGPDIVDPFDLI